MIDAEYVHISDNGNTYLCSNDPDMFCSPWRIDGHVIIGIVMNPEGLEDGQQLSGDTYVEVDRSWEFDISIPQVTIHGDPSN